MRNLASFIIISLDGFYEGPNGEFDWAIVDAEFREFAIRQLDEAETLGFFGATYEHVAAYWPTDLAQTNDPAIASRMNTKPKLSFRPRSNTPTGPLPPSSLERPSSASRQSRPFPVASCS